MKSSLPKVLHEINSKPMISYVVDAAREMSPKKIIAVISRFRSEVKNVLGRGVDVAYQNKPLGTADAVKSAKKLIPANVGNVIVLYGDTPLITASTIKTLYSSHVDKGSSCTVLTAFLEDSRGYGKILRNGSGQFMGIVEDKDANWQQKAIKEINTGMYCFKREDLLEGLEHVKPLNRTGEFYLTDVFSWLFNKNKKIDTCLVDSWQEVVGVNSRLQLLEASEIVRKKILEKFIESGVHIMDLRTTFIDPSVKIGPNTKIFPFTYIEKDVTIGKSCSVGPYCHLREGSVLKDKASVGNFTEIKNSTLEEGTFMRHMSYVGDTKVGRNVNIGAGTVVANFDGKKKNKTVIKDKAFIGCDSVLIAPVVIGKKAIVGAGSVVTRNHNVSDAAVVAGVPAREIKKRKGR